MRRLLTAVAHQLRARWLRVAALLCLAAPGWAQGAAVHFSPDPGAAQASLSGSVLTLGNGALQMTWRVADNRLRGDTFRDLLAGRTQRAQGSAFVLLLRDGRALSAADMRLVNGPAIADATPQPHAARASEHLVGKIVTAELEDNASGLRATWRAELRDGSNYIRQEIALSATRGDVGVTQIRLIDWNLPDARVVGTVKGSPVVAGGVFAAFEHPLAACAVGAGRTRCRLDRELPLKPGKSVAYSAVIGVTPPGQLRRGFLYYLERARAHPYRAFLHYNSWYDLGYYSKYDQVSALNAVGVFGSELAAKRGVKISSFLFDDGWDDPATLWKFNSGFPEGFRNVRATAELVGAELGVWMSPWGGYGKPRLERLTAGRAAGYETVDNGFALSGPKYYRLFRDTCLEMVRKYNINQFKFDGTGNANRVVSGSEFDSDFDAAIHLIGELRAEKPDLFVNLTTGTYPSPFWLQYADSIWRGGEDHAFAGVGPWRERWITYRDADTYSHVVLAGPLFPLNSLMLHGLIYARRARNLDSDPSHAFLHEVRSYFGSGTQLQEMYITPTLLSPADWDNLAEAAKWSQGNADVLVDSHWVGGDPGQLEVYGWAAWKPAKGILVLRNPSDRPQSITVDLAAAFELPPRAPRFYPMHRPWAEDQEQPALNLHAGTPHVFALKPFEVLVLETMPPAKAAAGPASDIDGH